MTAGSAWHAWGTLRGDGARSMIWDLAHSSPPTLFPAISWERGVTRAPELVHGRAASRMPRAKRCQPVQESTSALYDAAADHVTCRGPKKKTIAPRRPSARPRPPSTAGPQPVEMMGGFNRMIKKKRRTRDEPQRIVTTRLLCRLQHPVRHPSRMQGLYSDAR